MSKILVTGASGFLGSNIVELAINMGHEVTGIDIRPSVAQMQSKYRFIKGDLNKLDIDIEIDIIIHTASTLPFGGNKRDFEKNNINAARKIAELAKLKGAFLVEIGSSSVYGRPESLPVTIETPLKPLDAYAKSKLSAENEIRAVLDENQYSIIRPRTILGSGRFGIFDIFFKLVLRGIPLPLPNGGKQIIQFVHVKDLARLSIFIAEKNISGIWPAASPNPKTLISYLKQISVEFKEPIRYIRIHARTFSILGSLAFHLKLTRFTPWHFKAFPYDNYVQAEWTPRNFIYEFDSYTAFKDTFTIIQNQNSTKIKKMKIKLGSLI